MLDKKKLSQLLKIAISLSIGIFLVLYIYYDLSEEDRQTIYAYFRKANYGWVAVSLGLATLSHMSRAWRWKYTMEPLGLRADFWNNFFAVMVGYIVNLALPRVGEASRCAVINRYHQYPFEKLFGTVIAERIADLLMLALIATTVFLLQFEALNGLLNQDISEFGLTAEEGQKTMMDMLNAKLAGGTTLIFIAGLLLVLALAAWYFIKKAQHPFAQKVRKVVQGLMEGVVSIWSMKKKWLFLLHTFLIWLLYILMFYAVIFSLPDIQFVPPQGVLAAFVMGAVGMVIVQGGLGAFPILVMLALMLYKVDSNLGLAFGWIMWSSQTLMVIFLGLLSFIALPIYNNSAKKGEGRESKA